MSTTAVLTGFKKLESELFAKGQVICQFRVNGMNLTEDDEKDWPDPQY